MNHFIPNLAYDRNKPLYIQIYEFLKNEIVSGRLQAGEKLPSLRNMAASLKLSITTIELAYSQLCVEGYIYSKEKSGYFIGNTGDIVNLPPVYKSPLLSLQYVKENTDAPVMYADTALFDFVKWKKCLNQVINELPDALARESAPEGESALRNEISHYLYRTRGVLCSPVQIIIAAGTQQILNIITSFFHAMKIDHIAYEDPGYLGGIGTFQERGFHTIPIPLEADGISLSEIEKHNPSVICVSPSNQFPSGIVMPAGKRYLLLRYASQNDSVIIEDDYASELRYFGRPVPPVKSLNSDAPVLYLGSFSSVLFPSCKISYMVLPEKFMPYYDTVLENHTQTCSKTEQLALALYMEKGLLQTHVKKLRKLYSQKISSTVITLKEVFGSRIKIKGNDSGLNILMTFKSEKDSDLLCSLAASAGLSIVPLNRFRTEKKDEDNHTLIFYYYWIPLEKIPTAISKLGELWL